MRINGQEFREEIIERIRETVKLEPGLSRSKLSRLVCEWLNFRGDNGKVKEMSCRVALHKLERQGVISLPRVKREVPSGAKSTQEVDEPPGLESVLADLGVVELVRIESGDKQRSGIWNSLMNKHHYLGAGPLCGAQIRYLIYSSVFGVLGGLAVSSAAWRLGPRERWVGWDEEQRQRGLSRVVCNSRFLILPQVRVPYLASHVLAQCTKRVAEDWQERYGYKPLLMETFVDRERYRGTCYRAANWIYAGYTQGRGRQDCKNEYSKSIKDIYLYPLDNRFREILCEGMGIPPGKDSPVTADWAEEEFGQAKLGDKRLRQRLILIARDFCARPRADVPEACGSRAKTKAAYRFFDHEEVSMEKILAPHYASTLSRIKPEKLVLAVQDTTSLDYTLHPAATGLGPIGHYKEGSVGLLLHPTLVINPSGTPLGLLNVQCWARNPGDFGKNHRRRFLPIEEKESHKWLVSYKQVAKVQEKCPGTRIVSVGDRESDIYDLFHLASKTENGPDLLVRAEHDRLLAEKQGQLWKKISSEPEAGTYEVHIPRRGSTLARDARLTVRFGQVNLKPPPGKDKMGTLSVYAVLAEEIEPPNGIKPLEWMLLTTVAVKRFEDAVERLQWYCCRWGIEIYHRTLKTGCRIEERRLGDAHRIESCLAIDMVVAWRILYLTKLGRDVPEDRKSVV